ncbi:MAG TPA: ATP-dependent 6-phosphofructokinase [Spirochaetia bacterium]|nr:ATP-dependent 6-phosphofructokinase [Spirochaetales bacterium]HQK33120.1 ATP-dependent 6-phosphofructokinase [Spirochaetales bacterium]HRS64806.1 ATP-dependent 6-phosphofructokinase [Spirochaetia bacterium]HRV27678.1 ATP-dependent 6-phosphofructokinase [Spirochaetia bacterium]
MSDFSIPSLGKCTLQSPIKLSNVIGDRIANYIRDSDLVRYNVHADMSTISDPTQFFEKAGPREKIYFAPQHVHAAIVTCGGLCPGLNDVIRSVVRCLWYRYGVRRISGIQFGYRGLLPEYGYDIKPLDPDIVDDIHKLGGTILGSSRGGGERTADIVDSLERLNINMLFTIGGDGTQKGSLALADEIERRNLKISVIGIPKTIDNDLLYVDRSFGFDTAVAQASMAVTAAHTEAHSSINGIGLVKLMGRESGFIAVHTVLAVHEVNFVLIPEVDFDLEGPNGLFVHLEQRLKERNHAVIVVAEGAGQKFVHAEGTDASGNKKLGDIGLYLKDAITAYFKQKNIEINMKYIDPSYIIRSSPANPSDSVYCDRLGSNAVHAAMAGKTKIIIGMVNNEFVHIPTQIAIAKRNKVEPESSLWRDAIEATRQPLSMVN